MEISARVDSSAVAHRVTLRSDAATQTLAVPAKPGGRGSAVNGGEVLMLALATGYCNDLYREAERLGLAIDGAQVDATADFEARGLAASNIRYRATVRSAASAADIERLMRQTDAVAEVHNTVRTGVPVQWLPAPP
jgi:organic hydroperoxide reductase OsmC/OhrA